MHVLPKKAIKISNFFVAENVRNCTDLRRWEYTKQPLRERQTNVYLKLKRCFVVLGNEASFQRSHLNPDLASDGAEPDLSIAVIDQDEMAQKARRIAEQHSVKIVVWRSSQRAELPDYFSLDCRQSFSDTTSHKDFLEANRLLSCVIECISPRSPGPASKNGSGARVISDSCLWRIQYPSANRVRWPCVRSRDLHLNLRCIFEDRVWEIRPTFWLNGQQDVVADELETAAGTSGALIGTFPFPASTLWDPSSNLTIGKSGEISSRNCLTLKGDYARDEVSTDSNSVANTSGYGLMIPTQTR